MSQKTDEYSYIEHLRQREAERWQRPYLQLPVPPPEYYEKKMEEEIQEEEEPRRVIIIDL